MVDINEFHTDSLIYTGNTSAHDELDLAFLEAIDNSESMFSLNEKFFDSLNPLEPKPAFVPSLHSSLFEEPLHHAVWTSAWPQPQRHFPA